MRFAVAIVVLAGCGGHPPALLVSGAAELGVVGQSALITGRDGGWGARVFGQEAFIFGDTAVTVPDALGSTFHSNSVSFTGDFDASDGISGLTDPLDAVGSPQPLIAPTDDEAAFIAAHASDNCAATPCGARWAMWPGATVFDDASGTALVAYGLIYAEPGAFNFHGVGQSLAVWSSLSAEAARPVVGNCADHPTLLFCENEPAWGMALTSDDNFVYAFACDGGCTLARFPFASALDRSTWTAWDGAAWSQLSSAAPLFDGGNSLRVSFNATANTWLAVYSANLSNDVRYRTAPSLTGPWSDSALLFTADHKLSDGGWTYDATWQPDYDQPHTLYVTYSRPTGTFFGSELALERISF